MYSCVSRTTFTISSLTVVYSAHLDSEGKQTAHKRANDLSGKPIHSTVCMHVSLVILYNIVNHMLTII